VSRRAEVVHRWVPSFRCCDIETRRYHQAVMPSRDQKKCRFICVIGLF
jgi:hypothetical protein